MSSPKIIVVDFGMGNLFSIDRAIQHVGGQAEISSDPAAIPSADRVILPGVGAFGKGMQEMKERRLIEALHEFVRTGRPLLGICLGMQLLLTESYEFGQYKGFDLIKGKVVPFKEPGPEGPYFKIPQVGWNTIELPVSDGISTNDIWDRTILQGIDPGSFLYFVHSYVCVPDEVGSVLAESAYGNDRFCSVIHRGNVWGCQFHPERSGDVGLSIYENFLRM